MPSRRERQSRARIGDTIEQLKAALFGLTSKPAIESLERHGRLQHSRYGHLGLSYVTADRMPEAVVNDLEAIEVEKQYGEVIGWVPPHTAQRVTQPVYKQRAVG